MIPSVPSAILESIEAHTASTFRSFSFASGGCINHGGTLVTSRDVYFLKWNDLKKFPGMFAAESRGLSLLRQTDALAVPGVVHVGEVDGLQFLLLEHIESASRSRDYWIDFGRGLAALHRTTSPAFGLDHDNYIGSLPQKNSRTASGIEFFITRRLNVQLELSYGEGKTDHFVVKKFDGLYKKLPALLPDEPPALLHGDLWGGNIMTTSAGEPCLIDPAVYFGYREADLAMTRLFGGFDPSFLHSYEEVYPLQPGYQERFDLYNLYPLLVHVNLFGGGYLAQVMSILKRFE